MSSQDQNSVQQEEHKIALENEIAVSIKKDLTQQNSDPDKDVSQNENQSINSIDLTVENVKKEISAKIDELKKESQNFDDQKNQISNLNLKNDPSYHNQNLDVKNSQISFQQIENQNYYNNQSSKGISDNTQLLKSINVNKMNHQYIQNLQKANMTLKCKIKEMTEFEKNGFDQTLKQESAQNQSNLQKTHSEQKSEHDSEEGWLMDEDSDQLELRELGTIEEVSNAKQQKKNNRKRDISNRKAEKGNKNSPKKALVYKKKHSDKKEAPLKEGETEKDSKRKVWQANEDEEYYYDEDYYDNYYDQYYDDGYYYGYRYHDYYYSNGYYYHPHYYQQQVHYLDRNYQPERYQRRASRGRSQNYDVPRFQNYHAGYQKSERAYYKHQESPRYSDRDHYHKVSNHQSSFKKRNDVINSETREVSYNYKPKENKKFQKKNYQHSQKENQVPAVIQAKVEKHNSVSQSGQIDLRPAVFIKDLQKRSIALEEEKANHKNLAKAKFSGQQDFKNFKEEQIHQDSQSLYKVEVPPKFQIALESCKSNIQKIEKAILDEDQKELSNLIYKIKTQNDQVYEFTSNSEKNQKENEIHQIVQKELLNAKNNLNSLIKKAESLLIKVSSKN